MIVVKITEHNDIFFDAIADDDPEDSMAQPLKAHYEMLKKLKEEGKFLGGYYLPGDDRSIQVFNFEDEAEMDNFLLDDPMSGAFDSEMHVAVPILEHMERTLSKVPYLLI